MGGLFGVASVDDCVADLFYGTDYHSHLGTMRGGLAVRNGAGFERYIHDITNAQFRSKFEDDLPKLNGPTGIGVISDFEDQPLIIGSHHGVYAIATVGKVDNLDTLVSMALSKPGTHFSEMTGGNVNPTQVVAHLIDQGESFAAGIAYAQEVIEGSCSILLLTDRGIYAARDRLGRTPLAIGEKPGTYAVTLETCALPNLGFQVSATSARERSSGSRRTVSSSSRRRAAGCRSARSSGSTTATPPRAMRTSTSRRPATAAAASWPSVTTRR